MQVRLLQKERQLQFENQVAYLLWLGYFERLFPPYFSN